MKTLKTICYAILFGSIITSCNCNKKITCKDKKIDLQEAFTKAHEAVQQAIKEAEDEGTINKWKLEQADLEFTNVTTTTGEAGAKLYIFEGKLAGSRAKSNKATFTFKRKDPAAKKFADEDRFKEMKDFIKKTLKTANETAGNDDFELKEFEVEIEFTVKCSAEAGVTLEIAPITPSAKISRERENVHTITLKFSRK